MTGEVEVIHGPRRALVVHACGACPLFRYNSCEHPDGSDVDMYAHVMSERLDTARAPGCPLERQSLLLQAGPPALPGAGE